MWLLLDTHALLWWLLDDASLSQAAAQAIGDPNNDVFVSSASAWEIAIKYKLGKLPQAEPLLAELEQKIAEEGFTELPIGIRDGKSAGSLPRVHNDPFDRMLVAQALAGSLMLVSNDSIFDSYGVLRLW